MKTVICQNCRELIGKVDPEKLSLPLKGYMFESVDDRKHPPFPHPDVEWEFMRCPYGPRDPNNPNVGHRPFRYPNQILTFEDGLVTIEGEVNVLMCPKCVDVPSPLATHEDKETGKVTAICPIHDVVDMTPFIKMKEETNGTLAHQDPEFGGRSEPVEEGKPGIKRPTKKVRRKTTKRKSSKTGRRPGRPKGTGKKKSES